jgi:hypothetical protein
LHYRATYKLRAHWTGPSGGTATSPTISITTTNTPGAPARVSAVRDDSNTSSGGRVRVTWDAAATGASAVQKYTVVSSGGPAMAVPGSDRSAVIAGLVNGTRYTFAVYATNASGKGPTASASATPARVPFAPSALTATEDDAQAALMLTPSGDGGSSIQTYQATSNRGSVGLQGSGATRIVTGLTNGQSYTFQIRACNAVGCGPWSASSNAVTPYGNPSAPSVSVSVSGQTLDWSWNTPNGNGRPIDHFEVTLDGTLIDGGYNGTSHSQTFGSGETHILSVVAVNNAGLKSAAGSRQAATQPVAAAVTVSKGAAVNTSGCTVAACAYLRVSLSGFSGGSHTVQCWSDFGGPALFYTYVTNNTTTEACYFGYPGYHAWAVVDGVESNHITW